MNGRKTRWKDCSDCQWNMQWESTVVRDQLLMRPLYMLNGLLLWYWRQMGGVTQYDVRGTEGRRVISHSMTWKVLKGEGWCDTIWPKVLKWEGWCDTVWLERYWREKGGVTQYDLRGTEGRKVVWHGMTWEVLKGERWHDMVWPERYWREKGGVTQYDLRGTEEEALGWLYGLMLITL